MQQQPIAPRKPRVANHRANSTPMNTSHGIDFDGTLVPLFFFIAPFRSPGFLQSLALSLSLFLCDELAELTGCEPVVKKRMRIYSVTAAATISQIN